ncbi:hypothetical protein KIW84_052254 [Lathyrus oleraceus]|uniref:Uncharacterized protein n=1 Tax=Pisum sativum TaxID=3888 RepID=A0A9D4WR80_PEA|nr:hypothetical protein KIW84_052254 [Pisum sativum]
MEFSLCPNYYLPNRTLGDNISTLCSDSTSLGRVTIGLYGNLVPRTVSNSSAPTCVVIVLFVSSSPLLCQFAFVSTNSLYLIDVKVVLGRLRVNMFGGSELLVVNSVLKSWFQFALYRDLLMVREVWFLVLLGFSVLVELSGANVIGDGLESGTGSGSLKNAGSRIRRG